MKLSKEEKLKYWITILAKAALILFLLIKGYHYLFQSEPKAVKTATTTYKPEQEPKEIKKEVQPVDILKSETPINASLKKNTSSFITISKVIKYKGLPLENAYFTIDACQNCSSTKTAKDGITQINIPNEIYKDGLTHQFYVYQGDSLLYQKSMRFINLQLDEY